MRLNRALVANIAFRLLGRGGSIIATVVMIAIMSRSLDSATYGQIMFLTTLVTVFAQVADFGSATALSRLLVGYRVNSRRFWGNYLLVRIAIAIVAVVLATGLLALIQFNAPLSWQLAAILTIPIAGSKFFEPLYQIHDHPSWIGATYAIFGALLIGLSLAVAWLQWEPIYFLWASLLANLGYLLVCIRASQRLVKPAWTPDRRIQVHILRLSLPIGIAGLLTTVISRAAMFFLERYTTPVEVGYYASALRILDLCVAVAIMAIAPIVPLLATASTNPDQLRKAFRTTLSWIVPIAYPIAVLAPLIAEPVVHIVFGPQQAGAVSAAAGMIVVGVLAVGNLTNSYLLLAVRKVNFAIWLTGSAAAASVILNMALVPEHGLSATVWIMIGIEAGMLVATTVLVYLNIRWRLSWSIVALSLLSGIGVPLLAYANPLASGWTAAAMALGLHIAVVALAGRRTADDNASNLARS